MRWTPDGTALAMCWEHGGFSIWSVFGSLLHHSMAVEAGYAINPLKSTGVNWLHFVIQV